MDKKLTNISTYQLYLNSAKTLKISSLKTKAEVNMIEYIDASTQTNIKERKSMMLSLLLFPLFILMSAVTVAYNSILARYHRSDESSEIPKIDFYRCKRHSICEVDSIYSSRESLNTLSPPNGLRVPRRSSVSRRRGSIQRTPSIHLLPSKSNPKYIAQDNYIWRMIMSPLSVCLLIVDFVYNTMMMPVYFTKRVLKVVVGRQLEGGDILDVSTQDIDSLSLTPAMLRRASTTRLSMPFHHLPSG